MIRFIKNFIYSRKISIGKILFIKDEGYFKIEDVSFKKGTSLDRIYFYCIKIDLSEIYIELKENKDYSIELKNIKNYSMKIAHVEVEKGVNENCYTVEINDDWW